MIKFFSTGYFSRYLLLVLLALVLWMPSILYPSSYTGISSYAFNQLRYLTNHNLYLQTIIAFFLTLYTSFLINKIAINNGFNSKISTLVAFLYIILTSVLLGESHNNPVIWVNFILTFALANLLRLPYAKNTIPVLFNASFYVGIASFFYPQLVFLIVFIWLSIILHKVVTWRNFTVTFIGIILPYFFLLTLFFYTDHILEESFVLFNSLQIDISPIFLTSPIEIIISIIFIILIFISVTGIVGKLNEKSINLRRNLTITIIYLITAFLILIFFSKSLISTILMSIPSALLIGHWLSTIKKERWYNIALLSAMSLIILNQYIFIFWDVIK